MADFLQTVKERVVVGELHETANGNNQQMRIELLVLLHHPVIAPYAGGRRIGNAAERS